MVFKAFGKNILKSLETSDEGNKIINKFFEY